MPRGKHGTCMLDPYRHLIGTTTDTAIAEMAGCSRELVRLIRNKMGLPRLKRARKEGVSERVEAMLAGRAGTMSDAKLGKLVGTSGTTVNHYRKAMGIPAYGSKDVRASLSDEHIAMLGQVSDVAMGELTGYAFTTIHRIRTRLGIKMQVDGRRKK